VKSWVAIVMLGFTATACSHSFRLVEGDAGTDVPAGDATVDAAVDAGVDGPPGSVQLTSGGLGGEAVHSGPGRFQVIGGFSTSTVTCPAIGLCVQGGIHP
jgi:hypothetical protein